MSFWDEEGSAEHWESSVMDYEESLDPEAYEWRWDGETDRYDRMADEIGYRVLSDVDDRPAWERGLAEPRCRRCERERDLDALGTCEECRREDGRCTWCGLDRVVYTSTESCRTCYRQLDRLGVADRPWDDTRLRVTLLVAGFRRSDLRKRRAERASPT